MHKIFDALDESQKKAVFHSHGPALVVAGPGSGKTTVILARVWYLIRQCHVPPEQILVLTFTKAAASSLQNRLFSFTDNIYVPVSFGTFHSFIFQILRQYGSYKDSNIITTKEKQALLAELGFCDKSLHKDISNEQTASTAERTRTHLKPYAFFAAIFPLCRSFFISSRFFAAVFILAFHGFFITSNFFSF